MLMSHIQKVVVTAGGLGAFVVMAAMTPTMRAESISFSNFSDVSAWTLNGNASQQGSLIRVTPNAGSQAGSAWHTNTVSFASDYTFAAHYAFDMPATGGSSDVDGQGADGMTFTLHTDDNGASMLGAPGGAFGLANGNNNGAYVAVAMDTWSSGAFDPGGNADGNHYEIDSNLQGTSHYMSGPHVNNATPDNPARFQGAGTIDVWIDYHGPRNAMSIYESRTGGPKPTTPIIREMIDLNGVFSSTDLYVGFTGGTGGATAQQNALALQLNSSVGAAPAPPLVPTVDDFDNPGTPYTVTTATAPASAEVTASGGNDFLRLNHQQDSNRNYVGFDRTTVGTVDEIKADWDMRMFKNNPTGTDQRFGDGYSVGLLDTLTYGTTGAAPSTDTSPERWALTNSLTVGFIGFDGSYGGKKDVEVYYNGAKQGPTVNSTVDFTLDARTITDPDENVPWTHVQLLVEFLDTGGANVSLYLGGTEAEGSGTPIINSLFIAGMNSYQSRLAFGGRNGGAINYTDLDNINVQFIPEPSALALAAVGLLGLRRRRR